MDVDVIVIGAGAAGLAAARRLAARALRVIVVEARDRAGGRVHSRTVGGRAAVPAELGAEFIHGRAPETMALLREAGATAIDTSGASWSFADGALCPRGNDEFAAVARIFKQTPSENDESVERFLARFEGDASMRESVRAARSFAEGFDAADPTIASARSIGEELQSGVDSLIARPLGGYRLLIEHLRNACAAAGVRTYLSTRVRHIAWRNGHVRVLTDDDGRSARTIDARTAIVTLPVGVLRHTGDDEIVFQLGLPAAKRDALEKLEMGQVVRLVLSFRTAFWERICDGRYRDVGYFWNQGSLFPVYWTQLPLRSELIVAWAGGPKATALRKLSHDELIETALDGFGALFDERTLARSEFEGGVTHDWNGDPFARGAYSYVAVGGGDARASLAAPVNGSLFFAGEATSGDGQGGTVNGALETGERAAREVLASFDGTVR